MISHGEHENIAGPAGSSAKESEILEQFNSFPYPGTRRPAKLSEQGLYLNDLRSAFWRVWQEDPITEKPLILDAGCGSGSKIISLSKANPGASFVGIDISGKSLELARQMAHANNLKNVKFFQLRIEDIASLGLQFDYINADEVLYLVPDPAAAFKALGSVLKSKGILRANLHCAYQRGTFLRLQRFLDLFGLMDGSACAEKIGLADDLLRGLLPSIPLKAKHWRPGSGNRHQHVMSNWMLRGDKGFEFPHIFQILDDAGLELRSMLNWNEWEFEDLFQNGISMADGLIDRIQTLSLYDRLTAIQLLCGNQRLLDFWAAGKRPRCADDETDFEDLAPLDSKVILHTLARKTRMRETLLRAGMENRSVALSSFWNIQTNTTIIDPVTAAILVTVYDNEQTIGTLAGNLEKLTSPLRAFFPSEPHMNAETFVRGALKTLRKAGLLLVRRSIPSASVYNDAESGAEVF